MKGKSISCSDHEMEREKESEILTSKMCRGGLSCRLSMSTGILPVHS